MPSEHYQALARLFLYPDSGFAAEVARTIELHAKRYSEAARRLEEFLRLLPVEGVVAWRELHTRTFDVQAIASLDIGYTLFGEDYKRGALLANLSAEHNRAGNDCGTELADHLPNILRLLPKMADPVLREEFVRVLLAPALREMIREFEPVRLAKKEMLYQKHHKTIIAAAAGERRTAWRHALEAVLEVFRQDFALHDHLPLAGGSMFAASVGTEMGIEGCAACAGHPGGAR